jgi:hypothetical protein
VDLLVETGDHLISIDDESAVALLLADQLEVHTKLENLLV